jgi:hypothetical protein
MRAARDLGYSVIRVIHRFSVKVAQRRCGSGFSRDETSQAPATSQITAASQHGCQPLPGKPFIDRAG